MKLTLVLLVTALLQVHAAGFAQTITLNKKNITLNQAFKEIKKQTGYDFLYNARTLENSKPVDIHVTNAPLQQVLEECFADQPLVYSIDQKTIIVKAKELSFIEKLKDKITEVVAAIDVSGRVLDENGSPIPGATITVKNANIFTVSDQNGYFTVRGVQPDVTLIISVIGYEKKEVQAASNVGNIRLIISQSKLDEVQVVAYGQTTQRFNVGSIGKVSQKEIEEQPVTNPLQALQGKIAGVFVQNTNGLPGGNITVRIRGQNSIVAGLDPLYIVDGMPFTSTPLNTGAIGNSNTFQGISGPVSPLNSIPPDNIESIEVLKDAAATALYGSRGANGVVIITTKRGKPGKTKVNFNVTEGASTATNVPQFLNLQQFLALEREGYKNDGLLPSSNPSSSTYNPYLMVYDTTKSTNWAKIFLGGIDHVTQANGSISGGNENTNFIMGGNYRTEGSIIPGDLNYRRTGIYANIQHHYDKFYTSFNFNYSFDDNNGLRNISAAQLEGLAPDYPIYNPDGSLNWAAGMNPIAYQQQKSQQKTGNLILNGILKYNLIPGLDIKANIGYTKISTDMLSLDPATSENPAFGYISSATFGSQYNQSFVVEPQLEYTKQWNAKNRLNILLGSTIQHTETKGWAVTGTNYSNDAFLSNLSFAGTVNTPINNFSEYKYFSLFGQINYVNSDKYVLNINGRRDGSSKFGPGNQYGNFGSIGAGWIFSEENFFKTQLPFLSYGKLKASYGIVGNDQITPYKYISTYGNSFQSYQSLSTISPNNIANSNYKWEINKKAELGLELGFLNNRILFDMDAFLNRCDNLLVNYPLPRISGPFGTYQANFPGVIQNKGLEFTINTDNIRTKSFSWHSNFNFSLSNNKLVSFPNIEKTSYANTYVVGKDLSVIKGYQYLGVNPQTGVYQYADLDGDGKLSQPQDYIVIGKRSPDYYGGLGNNLTYTNFQLDFFFDFVQQHNMQGTNYTSSPISYRNSFESVTSRWQNPGDITNVQKAATLTTGPVVNAYSNLANSSAVYINTSYIRLQNVALSYNLPKTLLEHLKMQQFKIYMQAQNLFLFTPAKNVDPETVSSTSGGSASIPVLKSIVFGLQLTL